MGGSPAAMTEEDEEDEEEDVKDDLDVADDEDPLQPVVSQESQEYTDPASDGSQAIAEVGEERNETMTQPVASSSELTAADEKVIYSEGEDEDAIEDDNIEDD